MEFRSTNDIGYSHYQGDIVTNVSSGGVINSSHGVHLTGGSTGGIVQAAGDETNIALTVRGKGAGPLNLISSGALALGGATSTQVTIASTFITLGSTLGQIQTGGSTSPWQGFIRTAISSFATPNFNTTNAMVMETTHTFTGINSSYFIVSNSSNLSTDWILVNSRCSTVAEVRCSFLKASTLTVAASSARVSFLAIRF